MSGHTPGPWQVREWAPFGIEIGTDELKVAKAFTGDGHDSFTEEQANARLIAAAPELLEAAKEVCRLAGRDGVNTSLAKAITKAEGRK